MTLYSWRAANADSRSVKRILYVGMRADYGDPQRGVSFEERNFHHPLRHQPDVHVDHFDFVASAREHGQAGMTERLIRRVEVTRPDLLFMVLFDDATDPLREAIRDLTEHSATATLLWICDDHWRFDDYSSRWAPCLDWIVTTDADALPKYQGVGMSDRAILSQWAVNQRNYGPTYDDRDVPISFVGQPHGDRAQVIGRLQQAGLPVVVAGHGWGAGIPRLPFYEMVRMFSRSRINLNLANSSVGDTPQIKGRNFEVPGCHAFLLTPRVPYLDRYFDLDREVVVYDTEDEMLDKIRFYLQREDRRRQVATRGYARCMREHTWDHRFRQLFARIGLHQGAAKRGVATAPA